MKVFSALGSPHEFRKLDVSSAADWRRVTGEIVASHGRIDVAVLNAGVMSRPRGAPIFDSPLNWFNEAAYARVKAVNFDGVTFGIMALLGQPGLSRVIVIASGAALTPLPMDPFYTATKFAVLGLARALAPTLMHENVRIDVLCPGAVDTPMTPEDVRASFKQQSPGFIADGVVTLLSADDMPAHVWRAYDAAEGLVACDDMADNVMDAIQTAR
jgi:NAD(P)-dependent dehydrogenase (short-subunit alcohol dehydrogenase family)